MMNATKKKKLVDFAGIAAVIVLAAVGVWMATGDGGAEELPPEKAPVNIKPPQPVEVQDAPAAKLESPPPKPEEPHLTNLDGSKLFLKPGDVAGSNVLQTVHGTVRKLPKPISSGMPPVFDNDIHAMMASYIQPGVDMPPPEHVSDKDALAACETAIEILDGDTSEIRREKEIVSAMLGELREYIEGGGSADSYFHMLQERQEAEAEAVNEVRRQVNELINDDKIDDAVATLEEFNKYLDSKGIPAVKIKRLNRYMQENAD